MRRKITAVLLLAAALLAGYCFQGGKTTEYISPAKVQLQGQPDGVELWLDREPVQIHLQEGTATLSYEATAEVGALYVVSVEVTTNIAGVVQLSSAPADDYNAHVTFTACQGKNVALQRVCKATESGQLRWQLQLSADAYPVQFTIKEMQFTAVEEHKEYTIIRSSDSSIEAVLSKSILVQSNENIAAVQRWADALAACRVLLRELVGGVEPQGGKTTYLFTESFGYYALSGEVIYVNSDFVPNMIEEMVQTVDVTQTDAFWVTLHELSHVFDGIRSSTLSGCWNFEKETMADLKAAMVLAEYWKRAGESAKTEIICKEFLESYGIDRGVYSAQGAADVLFRAMMQQVDCGWSLLRNTFTALNQNMCSEGKEVRFSVFWNELNKQYGGLFQTQLPFNAWRAIADHFDYEE